MNSEDLKYLEEYRTSIAEKDFDKNNPGISCPEILKFLSLCCSSFLVGYTFTSFMLLSIFGASIPMLIASLAATSLSIHFATSNTLYHGAVEPFLFWANKKLFVKARLKKDPDITEIMDFSKTRIKEEYNKVLSKSFRILDQLQESADNLEDIYHESLGLPDINSRTKNQILDLDEKIKNVEIRIERLTSKRDLLLKNIDTSKKWLQEERNLDRINKELESLQNPELIDFDKDSPVSIEGLTEKIDEDVQYFLDYKEELDN